MGKSSNEERTNLYLLLANQITGLNMEVRNFNDCHSIINKNGYGFSTIAEPVVSMSVIANESTAIYNCLKELLTENNLVINVNNGERLNVLEELRSMNEGDIVMLFNYYHFIKDNDYRCVFINPYGTKERSRGDL